MKDIKLTILLITEYLPPQINGISTRCYNFIKELRNLGHTVHIAGPDTSPLTSIKMTTIDNDIWNKGNKFCFLDIDSSKNIMRLLPDLDIVHIFYPFNFSASFLFPIFKLHNIPVICSHHCDPSYIKNVGIFDKEVYELLKIYHKQFNTSLVSLNLVPTITEEIINFMDNFIDNLKIIPSGFDKKLFNHKNIDFKQKNQSKVLVYVGRLSPEKNCEKMLDFFEKLIQNPKFKSYRLIIVGDGPSRMDLENKKIPNVSFIGYVEHDKVAEYYKKAQAFVTFSVTETFGFTNIEALACATPIIYPKCKVFDTYYKNEFSKTRIDVDDYKTFEKAVENTYKNQNLQKKTIEYCKNKDWKSATKNLIDIYHSEIIKTTV
jgi:glycosyltransferase involved in cell wall biosynthesis